MKNFLIVLTTINAKILLIFIFNYFNLKIFFSNKNLFKQNIPKLKCNKGYYCPNTTSKIICPPGHYCPYTNMKSPIDIPTPCLKNIICKEGSKKMGELEL